MSTLRDLALLEDSSVKRLLEGCDLAPAGEDNKRSMNANSGKSKKGRVASALRALASIPVVKQVSMEVRPEGGDARGVSALSRFGMKNLKLSCLTHIFGKKVYVALFSDTLVECFRGAVKTTNGSTIK